MDYLQNHNETTLNTSLHIGVSISAFQYREIYLDLFHIETEVLPHNHITIFNMLEYGVNMYYLINPAAL